MRHVVGKHFSSFDDAINWAIGQLGVYGEEVNAGRWQGVPTADKPDLWTKEIINLQFQVDLRRYTLYGDEWIEGIANEITPSLPWANEHFAERVGGVPLNPDPSHEHWPWWQGQDAETKIGGKFSHTYSERFWPKYAGEGDDGPWRTFEGRDNWGIRFQYGDYEDVLTLLEEDPATRQAYLPIFFPEDTGAVHRGRIPCSLGYHFLLRNNLLHCWYDIRSCDVVRHFRDDLYLATRLVGHTLSQLQERELRSDAEQLWVDVVPGILFFSCHSFHVHKGDIHHVPSLA